MSCQPCRRLLGTGCLPDVAGQPVLVQLHTTLDQLRGLVGEVPAEDGGDGGSDGAEAGPAAGGRDGWAAAGAFLAGRAAGDGQPGWLASATAAEAYACDAKISAVVTGHLDPDVVAAAVRAFLDPDGASEATRGRVEATLVRYAVEMLSGPAGLAAKFRARLPGILGAGVSLPLDVGAATATVPPHLRRAVAIRDRHCAFPGCRQKPSVCQVHHLVPRSRGGVTALHNLVQLCSFHHLIAIHRWGWRLVLNADGTTTATSPDGRRTFHSHSPPEATAA